MAKKKKPGRPENNIKRTPFNLSLRDDVILKIKTLAAKEKTTSNKVVESMFMQKTCL